MAEETGNGELKLTESEVAQLNTATTLLNLAKANLEQVLQPIRVRSGLNGPFTYDRTTGAVMVPREVEAAEAPAEVPAEAPAKIATEIPAEKA